jgi:hypothetical protein
MLLKYNIKNIRYKQRRLDVVSCSVSSSEEDTFYVLTFTTATPHRLNINDAIVFCSGAKSVDKYSDAVTILTAKTVNIAYVENEETIEGNTFTPGYYKLSDSNVIKLTDEEVDEYFDTNKTFGGGDRLLVMEDNFSDYTFSVLHKPFKTLYLDNVLEGEYGGVATVRGRFPFTLNSGDTFTIRKRTSAYQYYKEEEWNDAYMETETNPQGSNVFLGGLYVKFSGSIYKWTDSIEEHECTYLNYRYFTYPHGVVSLEDAFEVADNRLVVSTTNESGDTVYNLKNNLLFFEETQCINFNLPLASETASELNDEDIMKEYFKEKRESLIPKILDYEKRCFSPYYKRINNLEPVSTIRFNLFFRDRTGSENWTSNDGLGWNQYKIDSNGQFVKPTKITNGDLLGFLNFTDNDIYYQKKKVSKSFLRLSFYDSTNPLKQMLLFYSTIFLDSGDLYGKYIKNIQKKLDHIARYGDNSNYSLVMDDTTDLTVSFTVTDKFNSTKSSEGFYLYLFPDGIQNGEERTIYMKAEFNHAGYGSTIPLINPNNNSSLFTFDSNNFPVSLIDSENGSLKELYRQLYIPITVKYDETVKDFVYYFKLVNNDNGNLIINLFEPKINPID